ncbi:MAG: type II toxin-antitoxin system RelE/ParE family toxin, partial [Actinobacteria bacterium]|nr:type II toxin-antitoxin system RelE/ParE family toxin [Actinomycetota bacterium]
YDVQITRTAENDLKSIIEYILRDNKSAANKWKGELKRQIESLENFPMRCQIIPEALELGKNYRQLVYGNYRTIFEINQSTVIILRVIHSAQLLNL